MATVATRFDEGVRQHRALIVFTLQHLDIFKNSFLSNHPPMPPAHHTTKHFCTSVKLNHAQEIVPFKPLLPGSAIPFPVTSGKPTHWNGSKICSKLIYLFNLAIFYLACTVFCIFVFALFVSLCIVKRSVLCGALYKCCL